MRVVITVILLLFFGKTHTQQVVIDSLTNVLKTETRVNHKIDLHLGISRAVHFTGNYKLGHIHNTKAKKLSKAHHNLLGLGYALVFESVHDYFNGNGIDVGFNKLLKALEISKTINSNELEAITNNELAKYYLFEKDNPIKSIEILNSTLKKSINSIPPRVIGNLYNTLARTYGKQGELNKAIETFKIAINYFNTVKNKPHVYQRLGGKSALDAALGLMNKGQSLIYLSRIYVLQGDTKNAIAEIKKAEQIFKKTKAPSFIAWASEELGKIYSNQGLLKEAVKKFQQSSKLYEEENLIPFQTQNLMELAKIFTRTNEYGTAENYYKKSLKNARALLDTVLIMHINNDLGNLSLKKDNTTKALSYFLKNTTLNPFLNKNSIIFNQTIINLSKVYFKKKEYLKSLKYLHQTLKFAKTNKNASHLFNSYIQLSKNHLALHHKDSTYIYLKLAEDLQKKTSLIDDELKLQQTYAEAYEVFKDYQNALKHKTKYFNTFIKQFKNNSIQKLKEEEVRQNIEDYKKQKNIAEQEAKFLNQRNKLYIIIGLSLIVLIILALSFLYHLDKTKKEIENKNAKLHQLNTTKDKFFSIIAHDIRSPIIALETVEEQIDFYLKKNSQKKIKQTAKNISLTTKKLNSLLDNLLNWALLQQGLIPYNPKNLNLKKIINGSVELFKINALSKNINICSIVNDDIFIFTDELTTNTILRNLISNAIKFTKKGGKITIQAKKINDAILIIIADTGIGISQKKIADIFSLKTHNKASGTSGEKGTGLGLKLVKEMVILNKGEISVQSDLGKGSKFTIKLPFK